MMSFMMLRRTPTTSPSLAAIQTLLINRLLLPSSPTHHLIPSAADVSTVDTSQARNFHAKSTPLSHRASPALFSPPSQFAVEDDLSSKSKASEEGLEISKLGIDKEIVSALAQKGITKLFPIQRAVLEPAMQGRDMIGRARTGTGKTLAFGIPILDKIIQYNAKHGRGRNPLALVLAPTRELAKQVDKEFYEAAPSLDTICLYGGTPIGRQMGQLDHGVDMAVGTPGRVIDLLKRGALDLSEVQFVVLDEADQMLQVGFQEDVEVILERLPKKRQTLMFSATMPTWIKNLTRNYLTNPAVIDLVGESDQKLADGISLYSIASDSFGKASIIGTLITEHAKGGKCIVFTQTKRDADRLASVMGRQLNCEALHGDISQQQRERTLSGFRDGRFNILVATDVAARGLDVPNVDLVIHYELPNNSEIFVHRSGRTGRAGKKGSAILIYSQDQTRNVRMIERDVGCRFTELPHIAVDSGSADMFDIGRGGRFDRFGGPGGGGTGFGRSGPGGKYNGPSSGRYGSFGDSGPSSSGRGGNFGNSGFGRSGGFGNSDRSGGFGNSDRSGFGNSNRSGGFGSSDRSSGFGSSDRSSGFGNSGRSSGFGSSDRSGGFGGGFGSSDRSGGFGNSGRSSGFGSSDRSGGFGGGFGSSDRSGGFGGFGGSDSSGGFRDRSGGSRSYGLDSQSGRDENHSRHLGDE